MYDDASEGYSSGDNGSGTSPETQRIIQQRFDDRYEAMKSHYEQRILQLSEVIHETCASLCNDELLTSMKLDATSSAFMPAHISEILNVHIDAERERFLHSTVQSLSRVEAQSRALSDRTEKQHKKITRLVAENHAGQKAVAQVSSLEEKSRGLQQECARLSAAHAKETEQLRGRLSVVERERESLAIENAQYKRTIDERMSDADRLRRQSDSQAIEIRQLESTVEQSARDLAVIESVDAQEQQIKAEMKEKMQQIAAERDSLSLELGDMRMQLRYAEAEVSRLESVEIDRDVALAEAHAKQTQMMQQIESMLQTEALESQAAIAAVHEKMKDLRHKLITELTKEKRYSASLSEELVSLREFRDEKSRELRNAVEEEAFMREKFKREVQKSADLSLQLAEQAAVAKEARIGRHEADVLARQAQDTALMLERKMVEQDLRYKEDLLAAEEGARFRAGRLHDLDSLELRSQAYRLHYQNQMHESNSVVGVNPMRHSFGGLPSSKQEGHIDTATMEAALRTAKEAWGRERAQLEQSVTQYIMKAEKLQSELDMTLRQKQLDNAAHEEALSNAQKARAREIATTSAQHEHDMSLVQARLDEAGRNIEKLKSMFIEKKRQLEWHQGETLRLQQALSAEVERERALSRAGKLDHRTEEAKITELQTRLDTTLDTLTAAENSSAQQRHNLDRANAEILELKGRNAEAQAHAESLRAALHRKDSQLEAEKESDAVAQRAIQDSVINASQQAGISARLDERIAENSNLRAQLIRTQASLAALKQHVSEYEQGFNRLGNISDEHRSHNQDLLKGLSTFFDSHKDVKGIKSSGDVTHPDEVVHLRAQLEQALAETASIKRAALQDQSDNGAMLTEMSAKFQALMRQYESDRAGPAEEKDKEIARLRAQLAHAATAVAGNAHNRASDDVSVSSSSSGSSAAAKALAHRDSQIAQARKTVTALESQLSAYKQKMSELAAQLDETRRAFKSLKREKSADGGDLASKLADAQAQLSQAREELQRRAIDSERVEHLHARVMQEQLTEHAAALKNAQLGKPLNAFTPERASQAAKFSPGVNASDTTNNWSASPGKITRSDLYEVAFKAVLDALLIGQLIDKSLAQDLNHAVQNAKHSSVGLGQVVQSKVQTALETYKAEYQSALALTISQSEALHVRVSDLQTQLRRTQSGSRGLNGSHYDEVLSVDADSSRGGASALAELDQTRHEHAILVELTKLEGDARTKMLLEEMKDLQKRHSAEIERTDRNKKEEMRLLKAQTDAQLAGLQEEVRSLKQTISYQADSLTDASQVRTSTLDTKLQMEKNRRKELIREFEQIEGQHRITIEELESANLGLEQRCERAELQVTRLKMEILAGSGGNSSHLQSKPTNTE